MEKPAVPRFFQTWDPLPIKAEKPDDSALEQRIAKLAEFAAKNGPPFVDMLREKQRENPEYGFLMGGAGADYFRWKLYCVLYGLNPDEPLNLAQWQLAPHQMEQPAQETPQPEPPVKPSYSSFEDLQKKAKQLPHDVDSSFSTVLATLNSTRASIKESKDWFMSQQEHAPGLVAKMALHLRMLPTYERQICVIYLANDVLLKSLLQRPEGTDPSRDPLALAFQEAMPLMLHTAFISGNSSAEVHQRLTTIVDHWASRQIFSAVNVAFMKEAIVHGPENASVPSEIPASIPQETQAQASSGLHGAWDQTAAISHAPPWGAPGMHPAQQPMMYPPAHSQPPMQPQMGPGGWNVPPGGQQFGPPQGFGQPPIPPAYPGAAPMGYMNQMPFIPPNQMGYEGPPHPGMLPPQGLPQAWPPAGPPMPAAFPGPVMPAPPPEEPPTDPMSFPPGLLPELVKENLRTESNYHPLDKRDVIEAGIPEAAPVNAYLAAQLDKFAAELRNYKPGSSRADLEEDDRRQKTRNNLGEKGTGRYGRPAKENPPKVDDGSFKANRQGPAKGAGPAGLGFGAAETTVSGEEKADDPFSQYRMKRSTYYHDSLSRAQAAAEARLQAAS